MTALAFGGVAQAQDQTQRMIAGKIVQAFPSTQVVPCPEQYERSLKLGKSICLLDPSKTSNQLFTNIKNFPVQNFFRIINQCYKITHFLHTFHSVC